VRVELIDVLTPDGAPTGSRKPKPEIHRDGDWHLSVHIWIRASDGRLLIQRRSLTKENNPGLWDVSVAGHVSAGENAVTSALREVEEEIGLQLRAEELIPIARLRETAVLRDGRYIDNEYHQIFLVHRDVELETLTLQPGEVDAVAWTRPEDLLTRGDVVPHPEEYRLVQDLG
jgi:isopentenyl-diphosphate Delta-isomerase